MSNNLAIDASAYIAFAAGNPEVVSLVGSASEVFLPNIVLGELLYAAANTEKAETNQNLVHGFAAKCRLLPVTNAVAARYVEVQRALKGDEKSLSTNALWIAATCLDAGVPLLTAYKQFNVVDGLKLQHWKV